MPGNNYYRLKQIDLDGHFSYSSIATVHVTMDGQTLSLGVYPNPVTNSSKVVVSGVAELSSAYLTIVDGTTGRVIEQQPVSQRVITGVDFDRLPSGTYHLLYTDAAGNKLQTDVVK